MRLNQFHQKARLSAALAIDQLRSIFAKSADGTVTRSLDLSELEDRILLSVSPAAVIAESAPSAVETIEVASPLDSGSTSAVESPSAAAGSSSSNPESDSLTAGEASSGTLLETSSASELNGFAGSIVLEENSATEQSATEVIFVDQAVEDFDELVADLQAQRDAGRAIDFFVLDSNADGIDQIAETLEQYSDLDAVHIVSHGSDGSVKLGSHWLRIGSLDGYAGTIAGWGSAFSADGDLLFYGCDLAAGSRGELLVESIAALTGADVAASTDDTGSALRGGDWDFEYTTGIVEAGIAFSPATQASWEGLLTTLYAYESFDYAAGSLNGQNGGTGFATAWNLDSGNSAIVNATGLTAPAGLSTAQGGTLELNTGFSAFEQSRDLTTTLGTDGTTAWFSFLVKPDNVSFGGISFEIGDGTGTDNTVNIGNNGNDWLVGIDGTATGVTIDNVVTSGQTYFMAVQIDFAAGNDTVTLYVDPTAGVSTPDSPPAMQAQLTIADLGMFSRIGVIGGFSGNNAQLDEIRVGETFADVAPAAVTGELWFTTKGNGSATGESWTDAEIIQFGNSGDTFELDAGTTSGTFSKLPGFVAPADIRAMHYVESNVRIGLSPNHFDVQAGDLLLTLDPGGEPATVTLNQGDGNPGNDIVADRQDIVVYRPDTQGDYSAGEYFMLLDSKVDDGTKILNVHGLALVEVDTTVGGKLLTAGTFLVAHANPNHQDIATLNITGTGTNSAADNIQNFLTGSDLGNSGDQIQGLHLLQQTTTFNGTSLTTGTLLVQVNATGTYAGQTHEEFDVIALTVTQTEQDATPGTAATGVLLFDGSDVQLDDATDEPFNGFTIISSSFNGGGGNQLPTADAGGPYVINEGDAVNLIASASSDPDTDPLTFKWDLDNDGNFGEAGEPVTETPTVSWATLQSFGIDDDGVHTIGVQVDDGNGGIDTANAMLTVNNVAPTLTASGAPAAVAGSIYTLTLSASDPGDDTISSWTIDWGDGTTGTFAGNPPSVTHTYSNTGFTNNILVAATDEDGTFFDNDVYVPSYLASGLVHHYLADGSSQGAFTAPSSFNSPADVVVGPNGNLFVTALGSSRVHEFEQDGTHIREFISGANSPVGLAFNTDGDLYVAQNGNKRIGLYDGSTGGAISSANVGVRPAGLAYDSATDVLYFTAFDTGELYSLDGTTETLLAGGLTNPEDVALGTDGDLYVADRAANRVAVFNTNGAFQRDFAVSQPYGLTFAADGTLLVSSYDGNPDDTLGDKVEVYNPVSGTFLRDFVSGGTALNSPAYLSFRPEQQVTVSNSLPEITSNGGGDNAAINVAENTTAVTTVTATDADLPAQTLSYSISGGADQALFNINSGSGVLTFASARDFETPTDANTDNVYEVTVLVSDGVGGTDTQDISVTVTDVVEGSVVVVDTTSDVADGNTASIGALLSNKGADGRISLREAILATNNTTNGGTPDQIHFNIADNDPGHFYYADDSTPGALLSLSTTTVGDGMIGDFDPDYPYAQHSWFTIDLNTALPELEITDAVIIDGYTQAGATVNTLSVGHNASVRIELTSTGADGNRGITVLDGGDGSTIRGLAINGFDGAEIMVEPGADGVTIQGNFLGTDITGTKALGDGDAGVHLRSSGNLVGGPADADRNLLSGNNSRGVALFTFGPIETGNVIQNNYIGTDVTGVVALSNGGTAGIQIYNNDGTQVIDNVISGNTGDGVRLLNASAISNAVIQGNLIGVGADGTAAIGNSGHGIHIDEAAVNTTIGGTSAGLSNVIAHSGGSGIALADGSGTAIRGNQIFSNGGLGIDLGVDGVDVNDAGDGDTGPNGRQNFPVLTTAAVSGSDLTITGSLNSTAGTTFQIDFYASASADGSGHGEAERYLGSASVVTNGSGDATINETLIGVSTAAGEFVTATATDPTGNTSEFALNAVAVNSNSPPTITSNGGGAAASINVAENTTAVTTVTANDTDLPAQTLTYSISGGADQTLFNIDSGSGVLTFVSAPDFETPTDANTDNIYHVTVQVSDGQGGTDSQNISVTVTPVNEAPVNTVPGLQVISADEPLVFSTASGNAVQISDVDAGSLPLQVTLAATNATLTLSGTTGLTFSTGDGTSDATMTFTGSLTSINSAVQGLTLTPSPNFTGSASLQIATNDQGNTGAGGSLGDSDNVSVTVNAVSLTPTNEFLVNSNTINVQETSSEARGSHRAVSIAPDGNYVVVWSSQSQDGSGFGVYGQRYNKSGVALGGEFLINQTTTSDQKWATVATDGAGNFVVVWNSDNQDGSGAGVYARRYDSSGVALSGEFLVNTTTALDQDSPSVGMADDGRFVIVWEGNGSGDSSGIFGRLYDRTGSAAGNEFLINTSTFGTQSDPAVAMNADGRFVAVWDDNAGFQGRLFDASGTPQGNQFTIDSSISSGNGSVAMGSAGNFVATWRETIIDRAIFAQRFDSTGSTIGGQIGVNTTTPGDQTHPSIDLDEAGNFVIVWEGNGVGDANGVFGQKFDATGTAVDGEFRINQTTTGGQQNASVALIDGDTFVVAWSGDGSGDTSGVFARHYSSGVNNVPTADAGGPYVINEDDSLNLNGAASGDPDSDPLTYAWDLDNDGNYGEVGEPTTVSPTVSWATLQSFGITDDGIYTIGLQVDDGNGGVDSATTMLTVNNVPPTITSSSSVNVSENTTAVLTVAATDPADTVTYSLSGGVDQGLFTIDFTTGTLSFAATPDFEIPADNDTNNVYQVEVTASDGDGGTDVQTLSVTVIDQNDETPVVTPGQTFNVSESAANGTSLGNVLATDADAGTTFSNWQITGGNAAGIFGINAATGQLSVVNNSNLDFETTTGYVLSITVSDGVNTSAVETVSISVLDQNDETPVVTPGQTFNVSEAAANGSSLGNVLATDADAGTTFSNWTITGGNSDGIFTINGSTGELIVADNTNLDFETASGYVLSLTVSDGTNTSSVETVSVNVVDANEAPGVSLSPTSSSLSENADTSSAIILSVISVTDDALGTNSLSLSGIDAADFEIVGSSLRLRAGTPLDFETKPTYNVTVEVNDPLVGSSPDDSQSFTLTINDVNEAPTTSGLSNVVVNEDSPNVPITLTTAFSDAETASSLLTYSVIGNSTPALFNAASISGGTLTLDFAADAHGSSVITVQASDPAGATVSTAFTVTVQPVPDAPVATGDSYEVTENSLAVTASTGVLANDSDADGDALTALLISGPSNGSLVLLSDGGFTYTPDSAFSGIDSFVYQPFDGTSVGPARSVTLMVTRVAAPPPSSTDPGAGEPSDSTTPTESDSSTESTEREPAETSVESTPAVAEPIVAENAAGNVEAEPVQTEASTDDDRDDQMMVAYAIDSNDVSEFFGRGSDRLELRDAESVRIASVRLDESTGDSSSSADSFRSSLRFDGEDLSYLVSTEFIAELEQVEEEFVFEGTVPEWAAGTAVATTTGLSVGYIMWMLRGGYVLASVLSTMPVWQNVDPLPVLAALDAADDGDDESLETMIDRASEEADQSEVQATDDAPADGKRKEELQ